MVALGEPSEAIAPLQSVVSNPVKMSHKPCLKVALGINQKIGWSASVRLGRGKGGKFCVKALAPVVSRRKVAWMEEWRGWRSSEDGEVAIALSQAKLVTRE